MPRVGRTDDFPAGVVFAKRGVSADHFTAHALEYLKIAGAEASCSNCSSASAVIAASLAHAWGWALAEWFNKRTQGTKPDRRGRPIAIVALARRLVIALWRSSNSSAVGCHSAVRYEVL